MTEDIQHSAFAPPFNAALVFADGGVFFGYGIGALQNGTKFHHIGEICFNTSMTGYQEILTDPSYTGQTITFTFPHIGNTGTNPEDWESKAIGAHGLIVREAVSNPSNHRSTQHLHAWLAAHNKTGITGIDTRAITRKVRKQGTQNVTIIHQDTPINPATFDASAAVAALKGAPSMKGRELAGEVSTEALYEWSEGLWRKTALPATHKVVAIDYGVKHNILRCLVDAGCEVTVVPATTPAAEILAMQPDGVFLSNGPGDPAATGEYALPIICALVDANVPIFGICLGHQLLAQALGAKTEKMHQGHRGGNHPVQDADTRKVEITSQNHGFVVEQGSVPSDVAQTHVSLFDGTNEGIAHKTKPLFSVQHHPEASPGPHDSHYLFTRFVELMKQHSAQEAA